MILDSLLAKLSGRDAKGDWSVDVVVVFNQSRAFTGRSAVVGREDRSGGDDGREEG